MLTAEQNRLLTDVSPGTPLNAYWKQHWIPALRSAALECDGAPVRVELLCEHYVAFRTTDGTAGFVNEACPHRGVSLALGRNENNALTCIFHGWSMNAKGECVHMPTETSNAMCAKVPRIGYPVKEAGGIVWVYLGPGDPPQFNDFAFTHLPARHVRARASYNNSNWLQNVETLLDSAHIALLHHNTVYDKNVPKEGMQLTAGNDVPRYSFDPKPYGFRSYAERTQSDGHTYLRVTEYVAPGMAFIGTTEAEAAFVIMVVPVNNTKTLGWFVFWDDRDDINNRLPDFLMIGTDDNDDDFAASRAGKLVQSQDREAMRRGESWSGIHGVIFEDYAVAESIPIPDRTKEFLGSGDVAIVRLRRDLLSRIAASNEGKPLPESAGNIDYRALRSMAAVIPAGTDVRAFADGKEEERRAKYKDLASNSQLESVAADAQHDVV
ncbi:Rieske 2Fe-2S domain-containing protein [Burkholderia cenocepacia]|uniref:Rieske 2Fe-2S domain-containing protein n=1 Tax=Burkholderia cenocepacia TaxID=95486 RepID=UPI002864561C|nr:Rieske 2Fe-2S domain-containing protein [Burkholderia cenocepacia]MDR5647532.1 Rieske 2Fe-2S domain-containing protein [Burkholderia cenocepacia]